ncbi:unnamed protein product [Cylindrotheca closterium]|uniref:Uncharacterized protein n=1 Tax=Cylindrotheca closterium TaxID=2856 RepID=A0AAD2CCQ9_9STRA|nr:unnamed protein product [Cylindrotheca closterium]
MPIDTCNLKVVLLCKGPGSNADALRPNRDDSQWWGRRDALVRCISSFLFSPRPQTGSRELVFLFDDDLAKMTIKVTKNCNFVPTEKAIISLWKKAAQKLNTTIEENGMECVVEIDPTYQSDTLSAGNRPSGLDSKRQVLEYLQKHCPMEFLRSKGLNSNMTVILRKTNKKALIAVFNDWKKATQKGFPARDDASQRQKLFHHILNTEKEKSTRVIAGTLHEMFQEFPCYGLATKENKEVVPFSLVLFLGAVRDMSPKENQILQSVCKKADIPLVGIRFGMVPEFTSKILSILSFHHFHNAVSVPIERLLESNAGQAIGEKISWKPESHKLRVVCSVPMSSTEISTDLKARCRTHWCLIRVIVCTLWRSRLVSSDFSTSLTNYLHLMFRDGVTLELNEAAFVSKLANKHQAAPSEYQILAALKENIDTASSKANDLSEKKLAKKVMQQVMKDEQEEKCLIHGLNSKIADSSLSANFYREEEPKRSEGRTVVLLLELDANSREKGQAISTTYDALVRAARKTSSPFLEGPLFDCDCEDQEAASIIALQHFCNQNKLFTMKQASNKRKRDSGH